MAATRSSLSPFASLRCRRRFFPGKFAGLWLVCGLLLVAGGGLSSPAHAETPPIPLPSPAPAALAMVRGAREAVEKSHQGGKLDSPKLRMVYFTPSDAEPQADHQARLTRVMAM